jgi:hypothetical protein
MSVDLDNRRCVVIQKLYALNEGVADAVVVQDGEQVLT